MGPSRGRVALQAEPAEGGVPGTQAAASNPLDAGFDLAPLVRASPRPGVTEPERGQQMEDRRLGAPIGRGDPDEDVVGCGLRVLSGHVEVAVPVEEARVQELELRVMPAAAAVLLYEARVGIFGLGILVESLHVGVRRGRIEVEVALLHVLAVVSLRAPESEEALLEDRILAVPEREGETEPPFSVRDAEQSVLAPAVGAAASVIVRKVVPAGSVRRVVFADRSPLPLGEIRSPALPVLLPPGVFLQPAGLRARLRRVVPCGLLVGSSRDSHASSVTLERDARPARRSRVQSWGISATSQ